MGLVLAGARAVYDHDRLGSGGGAGVGGGCGSPLMWVAAAGFQQPRPAPKRQPRSISYRRRPSGDVAGLLLDHQIAQPLHREQPPRARLG